MSDKSPKKLDKLFRKGSEQYDFGYNAEAWQQMESLLDKDDRRRFFWWWFGGAGLLLVGAVWFFGGQSSAPVAADPVLDKTEYPKNQTGTTGGNQEKQQGTNLSEIQKGGGSSQNTDGGNALPNHSTKTNENGELKNATTPQKRRNSNKKENNAAKKAKHPPIAAADIENKKETGGNLTDEMQNRTISQNYLALDTLTGLGDKISHEKDWLPKLPILPLALLEYSPKGITATVLPMVSEREEGFPDFEKEITPSQNNALFIGLVAASEMTSVGMGDFSKTSWKVGGQVEYRYRNKYSTSLGANFMRKKYTAGWGEYIPPKGFWTRTIAPQSTDGTCNILEVPFLIGYYPSGHSNSGFYANAGLTTYFILWEWYDYSYSQPDPDLIRTWQTSKVSQYWFGIGQFSVGYNMVVGRRTSLQFEPYLQIPLTGVGHGNVKLWSIGVSLKANFKVK